MRLIDSRRDNLTAARWDSFVASDPGGHLLQTWAWGDLKSAFGWTPVRIAVEQDGELIAGAQVLYRRLGPLTLGYIPKGPVWPGQSREALEALWPGIHRCSRRLRAIALKIEPEWTDDDAAGLHLLDDADFVPSAETIQPMRTIIVDLTATEEDILARMKPKWRYNVRLSMRRGVEVREAGLDGVEIFHRLMGVTGERDQFGVHSLAYYKQAMARFAEHDQVRLFLAYHEGEPLAGLMAFAFNGQAWYMYGASSDAKRSLMPNHQLQWHAMQWAKSKGCRQYDLWGITNDGAEEEALAGVERFKAGFGGKVVRYVGAFDHVYLGLPYWLMNRLWARRRARTETSQTV